MGLGGQQPGDVVADRFRLVRKLGAGGMGAVWHATHVVTGRTAALKFLHAGRHADANARARLLREARAAGAVEHPAVVPVHDVIEVDGAPVLVMDLLEGESLRERLDREGRLSARAAVDVALSVLGVLSAAHEKGIVHRDLKPENVFLSADGIHVLDFGIAKITRTDGLQGLSTATGALLGTPHYMAPEQAFGEKDVDGRADLWALGVLLYECLSGTRPIEGDNLGQILRAMTECKSTPLLEVAPEVDPELAKVVDGLLVERSERPSDAALVSASLQALAGTLSGTVRVSPKPKARGAEATTAEPVTREAPRSRSRGGYVIGAVAVALGAWVVFPRAPRAHSLGRGLGQVTVAAVSAATVKSEVPEPPVEPKAVVPRVFRRVVQPKAPPSAEPPEQPARPDKLINEPPF